MLNGRSDIAWRGLEEIAISFSLLLLKSIHPKGYNFNQSEKAFLDHHRFKKKKKKTCRKEANDEEMGWRCLYQKPYGGNKLQTVSATNQAWVRVSLMHSAIYG